MIGVRCAIEQIAASLRKVAIRLAIGRVTNQVVNWKH
jgi:hypothetical protein